MQQDNGWMPTNNDNPDKQNEQNATPEQQPQQTSGQPYQQPPVGQPYQQPQQTSGQPYQQPQQTSGQPYQQPPVGQPYQQPPVGQPYQQPPVGQPYQQPQQYQQPGVPPYQQPHGYQPITAEPGALGGLQANMASMLSYLFGWVTGLIFFFGDKRPEVRFHAAQSIVATGALSIISIVLNGILAMSWRLWWLLSIVNTLISLAALALIVYCMISAYNGKRVKLPIAGDFAERMVK